MPYAGLKYAAATIVLLALTAAVGFARDEHILATSSALLLVVVGSFTAWRHAVLIQRPTADTRKPVDRLTRADLQTFPLWEYALEEDKYDESYVQPVPEGIVYADRVCVLSATFSTRSGEAYEGLIELSTSKEQFRNPTISFTLTKWIDVTPPGGEVFCLETQVPKLPSVFERDFGGFRKRLERALGAPLEVAFPITWSLRVNPSGWEGATTGVLEVPASMGYRPTIVTPLPG